MIFFRITSLCLAVVMSFGRRVDSFLIRSPRSHPATLRTSATAAVNGSTPLTLQAAKETLVFTGDSVYKSDAISGCTQQQIMDFFSSPSTPVSLIGAGGKNEVNRYPTPLPSDVLELWHNACGNANSTYDSVFLPTEKDEVFASDAVIQFPGLRQVTTVLNGVKTRTDANGLPEYVFILIGERKKVSGSPPMVWIYNKLTGVNQDDPDPDRYSLRDATATSIVSIVKEDEDAFTFQIDIKLQIRVVFPSNLIKILPTTKEKMQQQGSAAVLKAVSNDIIASLADTRRKFIQKLQAGTL
ncbi:hypothetical protein MPSEU_000722600 [Mayamaea pseudoterrestris]|nr:hypothetical protein MPSEU_000722600 [Mayamaea pseudoterrestris]